MEKMNLVYQGGLRSLCTHERSGTTILTDAPVDNHGKGESFSPTDLLCTSLAACVLSIMGISGDVHGFSVDGVRVDVEKEMLANPRRVGTIRLFIDLRGRDYSEKQRRLLEAAANSCPVMLSLHPDVNKEMHFIYE